MLNSRTLPYRCPDCSAKLPPCNGMKEATQVVKRTCRRCGQRWQIKIATFKMADARYDVGTFVAIPKERTYAR